MSLSWSSLPDVDSKNNVCLIYTHQQTIDVLKAGLKVCWRAWGFNFLRCKRLCLFALFSDIKKATRAKWNKELWRKWWLLRSFFNHIFQFPMLKLQQTKKLEWKCEENIFFSIRASRLFMRTWLFSQTFLIVFPAQFKSLHSRYRSSTNCGLINSKQNEATRLVISEAIRCCFQFGVLPPCGQRKKIINKFIFH